MSKTCPFRPYAPSHHQLDTSSRLVFTIFICLSSIPCKPSVIKILSHVCISIFTPKFVLSHWPENVTTPLNSFNPSNSINVEV